MARTGTRGERLNNEVEDRRPMNNLKWAPPVRRWNSGRRLGAILGELEKRVCFLFRRKKMKTRGEIGPK